MRERLKGERARDYAKQTAAHFGVSTARLRKILGPDTDGAAPTLANWPSGKGRVHRAK